MSGNYRPPNFLEEGIAFQLNLEDSDPGFKYNLNLLNELTEMDCSSSKKSSRRNCQSSPSSFMSKGIGLPNIKRSKYKR